MPNSVFKDITDAGSKYLDDNTATMELNRVEGRIAPRNRPNKTVLVKTANLFQTFKANDMRRNTYALEFEITVKKASSAEGLSLKEELQEIAWDIMNLFDGTGPTQHTTVTNLEQVTAEITSLDVDPAETKDQEARATVQSLWVVWEPY
jgi:hypothetical protein